MSKVKCRFCKQDINKEDSYKDKVGKTSMYFCNNSHFEMFISEKEYKEKSIQLLKDICGVTRFSSSLTILINKTNKNMVDIYGTNQVMLNSILHSKKDIINGIRENSIFSSNDRLKYSIAFINNNIDKGIKITRHNNSVTYDYEMYESIESGFTSKYKTGKKDITNLLNKFGE